VIFQAKSEVINCIKLSILTPKASPAKYNDIILGPALIFVSVGSLALSVDRDNKAENNTKASFILSTLAKAS
jgi:hypothetical protein